MVANSLTWWFQSLEKEPTSLYIWIHNIIWIHFLWILIIWIHVIGVHIYHMNSYLWIRLVWVHIFSYNTFSIIAWAMSGEHLSPIRSLKYFYLPNGVMMVQWSWLLLSSSNVKCIVLHTNIKFSKKHLPRTLAQMSVIIGNGYCLHLMTLFGWRESLIQSTLMSFFGMVWWIRMMPIHSLVVVLRHQVQQDGWAPFWKSSNEFEVLGKT